MIFEVENNADNALITSVRTTTGLNNTITKDMKIVHKKFTPFVNKVKLRNKKHLYDVPETISESSVSIPLQNTLSPT